MRGSDVEGEGGSDNEGEQTMRGGGSTGAGVLQCRGSSAASRSQQLFGGFVPGGSGPALRGVQWKVPQHRLCLPNSSL